MTFKIGDVLWNDATKSKYLVIGLKKEGVADFQIQDMSSEYKCGGINSDLWKLVSNLTRLERIVYGLKD